MKREDKKGKGGNKKKKQRIDHKGVCRQNAEEGKRQTFHRKSYNHAAIQQSHYRAGGCLVLYRITAGFQRSF